MSTPPVSDPATEAFSASGASPPAWKRAAGRIKLPRSHHRRSVGRRVALAIVAGLGTLVLLLVADGVWATRAMLRGIADAHGQLTEGSVAVVSGDPAASVRHFRRAIEAADSATSASGHPSIVLAGILPVVGDNLRAAEAVAVASRSSAEAGIVMAETARALGWHDLRLPAVRSIGRVDLEAVGAAAPGIAEVAARLRDALGELESAGEGRLLGPVETGYDDAVATLRRRAAIADDAAGLAGVLPSFLGGEEPRRYLLAVQTLGRPQGIGGEVDLVGVLQARGGRVRLEEPLTPAPDALTDATAADDGRAAGRELLVAAEGSGLGEFDGVVLADSIWLAETLWQTGSVSAGDPLPVNSDQAPVVLERDVFEEADVVTAATRRAEVATAIVEVYLARRPTTGSFAEAMALGVAQGHLAIVVDRGRERRAFEDLGAGGTAPPLEGAFLDVRWNTVVDNHAAVFARRDIWHRVDLDVAAGTAKVRTVVTLSNGAPDDPPSALLGFPLPATVPEPAGVDPVGGWAADVRVAVPRAVKRASAETSIPSETETVRGAGDRPVAVVGRLAADPGRSMSLIVGYRIERAALDDGRFELTVIPQTAWPTGAVHLRIDAPTGTLITGAAPELEVGGATAQYSGAPTSPFTVWIQFD